MKYDAPPTVGERMVCCLAEQLQDGAVAQVGAYTPMVLAAALLAKATHAPNAIVYPIGPSAVEMRRVFPLSLFMVEPFALAQGIQISNREVIDRMQARGVPFEPLSPAQIDRFGNVNLSRLTTPSGRVLVLPGAAGVDALAIMPQEPLVMYVTRHTPRVFVSEAHFITGAGCRVRGKSRENLGIVGRGGPAIVITNLCVMRFQPSIEMFRLETVHPGVEVDQVIECTGFKLSIPTSVPTTKEPAEAYLSLLREEIDPLGIRDLEFLDGVGRRERLRELLDEEVALQTRLAARAHRSRM